jgi:DNA-binding NtrC family response regulator
VIYRVLVVDDEELIRTSLRKVLTSEGYEVQCEGTGRAGVEAMSNFRPHIAILDLKLPDASGFQVMGQLFERDSSLQVIVITAHGDIQAAVTAMKAGASDFLKKPYDLEEIVLAVRSAARNVSREAQLSFYREKDQESFRRTLLIGDSPKMGEVNALIDKVSRSNATTVLIQGESGTGKELVARALHYRSDRAGFPFMEVNCSSFQEALLENELFGHEKGAFTGAAGLKKGLVELSDLGTLFLDEVGDMPATTQSKLLRFIDNRAFKRVGGHEDITVDIRIIAATNVVLERAIETGAFRKDLYYRLQVVSIDLPPLRERGEDVLLLARHFMQVFSREFRKEMVEISAETEELLQAYPWPGNVRELKNLLERVVLLEDSPVLLAEHLPEPMRRPARRSRLAPAEGEAILTLEEVEDRYIMDVMQLFDGNKSRASRVLGMSRQGLIERLKRMERTGRPKLSKEMSYQIS